MRSGSRFVLLLLVCLMVAFSSEVVLAQNNTTTQALETVGMTANQEGEEIFTSSSEIQWLWGEVSAVDIQKNEITIKYLDYETDSEKDMKVLVDETATYENVKSINDIKIDDIISVDYVFSPDGRYIAKNISIEKTESKSELQKKITGEVENLTNVPKSVDP